MYILYRRDSIPAPRGGLQRGGGTYYRYRSVQIAISEEEKPLQDFIDRQKDRSRYYIEKQPERD